MNPRHQPLLDLFEKRAWPFTDTRPNKQLWILWGPGQGLGNDYQSDYARFSRWNGTRSIFLRLSNAPPDPPPTAWDNSGVPPLPVWVAIIRTAPGWHLEIPFYRGPKPYASEPSTDAEASAIINECLASGGYDRVALEEWRKAVAKKSR